MSSTGVTSPIKAAIQGAKGSGAQIVQIINLPQGLQNSARALRLEGQVTSQDIKNGTVRIETEKGSVEVKIQGKNPPQVGQKVEIEIPAGRQPRQASIRTDPTPQNVNPRDSSSQQVQTPQPQANLPTKVTGHSPQNQARNNVVQARGENAPSQTQAQNQTQQPAQTATNLLQTARNIAAQLIPTALQEALTPQKATNEAITPRILTPDTVVRLLAVPPGQAQNIAKEFLQTLPSPISNIISKAVFLSNLTAQNIATNTLQTPLLQIPTPQPLTQLIQNTPQTILNNTFIGQAQPTVQTTLQQTTFLQTTYLNTAQTLIPSQALSPALAQNITAPTATPTQIISTATLVPITFDPLSPTAQITQALSKIDIQIIKVTPPETFLKPPVIGNAPPSPIPAATQFLPPIVSANNATSLSAQITGFTAQGLPLITVQGIGGALPQSFILQQAGTNLQLGSQLQIIPKNGVAIAGQTSPLLTQALNNPLLRGFQWPALDTLYNTLQQISPQSASSLTRSIPNAGTPAQIGAAAMVFIAAVKSGNFEMALGDKKIDLLQRAGRNNILNSLTQDGSARGAPEPASTSEWRAVPMPMFWENEIHRITLFTRREDQDTNQENNGNTQTRFIFDLSLSRMGDVQIDGLIKDKRLDLVVRTLHGFSEPMQQTMRQAYTHALDQTELRGELNFQGSTQNWVHVLEKEEQLGVDV